MATIDTRYLIKDAEGKCIKEYKVIRYAEAFAQKNKYAVYDEENNIISDYRSPKKIETAIKPKDPKLMVEEKVCNGTGCKNKGTEAKANNGKTYLLEENPKKKGIFSEFFRAIKILLGSER